MGGWGLQLFCCDMDLDMIRKLTYDCGVNELENHHGKTPSNACAHHYHAMRDADHNIMAHEGSPESKSIHVRPYSTDGEENINFSLLASLCTHPDIVREYLDISGAFTAKMESFRLEALQSRPGVPGGTQDPWGPAYKLCLFGACGMTLGVKISDGERDSMRQYYKDCALMRDAVTQLGAALDKDSGYVNGVPWDFGSIARNTFIANGGPSSQEDLIFPGTGLLDTWTPDHGRNDDKMWDMRHAVVKAVAQGARPTVDEWTTTFASMFFCPYLEPRTRISSTKADARTNMWRNQAVRFGAFFETDNPQNKACGTCGAQTKADGTPLSACGECKKRKYCSTACQEQEWVLHKWLCLLSGKIDAWPSEYERYDMTLPSLA